MEVDLAYEGLVRNLIDTGLKFDEDYVVAWSDGRTSAPHGEAIGQDSVFADIDVSEMKKGDKQAKKGPIATSFLQMLDPPAFAR